MRSRTISRLSKLQTFCESSLSSHEAQAPTNSWSDEECCQTFVVPPSSSIACEHPKLPLIKAVARARGWYEKVVQGKAFNMGTLARDAGLTRRYVNKVFRCAYLAPDIIEAILAGRQPRNLNFDKLCQSIPLDWIEQREQLGFSPANTHRPRPSSVQ